MYLTLCENLVRFTVTCNEGNIKRSQSDEISREVVQVLRVIELKIAIKDRSGKCGGGNERERSRYDEDNGEEPTREPTREPSRWKRRGRVERQESRCRRRGFANVWLTGVRRRETRRERGSGTAGRSLGGEESGRAKRRHKTRDDDEDSGRRRGEGG